MKEECKANSIFLNVNLFTLINHKRAIFNQVDWPTSYFPTFNLSFIYTMSSSILNSGHPHSPLKRSYCCILQQRICPPQISACKLNSHGKHFPPPSWHSASKSSPRTLFTLPTTLSQPSCPSISFCWTTGLFGGVECLQLYHTPPPPYY